MCGFVSLLTHNHAARRNTSEPGTSLIVQLLEDGQSQCQVLKRFDIVQIVVYHPFKQATGETLRYTGRPG